MDKFFNDKTAVGTTGQVARWVVFANVLVWAASQVTQNPGWFNPTVVGIANIVIFAGMQFLNPKNKNF